MTGNLADHLFLVCHDERTGRALAPDDVLGGGLGAALLGELLFPPERLRFDHGLAHGVVEVAETAEGALAGMAIWQPEPGPEPKHYQQRLSEAVGHEHLPRFGSLDTALRRAHPRQPHLYLACCAVAPAYQSQGYGAALLQRRHIDIDGSKTPAYLMAASPEARRFFLRHGYGDNSDPITLLEGPRLFPMMRHPAAESVA